MLRETCMADWIVAAAGIAFVIFVFGSQWLEGKKKKRKKDSRFPVGGGTSRSHATNALRRTGDDTMFTFGVAVVACVVMLAATVAELRRR